MKECLSQDAARFRSDLTTWAEDNLREFPWRHSNRSVYEVFVAEFFLTQTPADNVARVYPEFLDRFETLEDIRDAGEEEIEQIIEPLGFQRMRAEALSEISQEHDTLPRTQEELRQLPRVGPYVANATLCIALNRVLPLLDRNVERVYSRVFGNEFPESRTEQIDFAAQMLPADGEAARTYNLALVDFGALVCSKQAPDCERCFAANYCDYYRSG